MLLTFFYMIATVIQAWTISFLKSRLYTIFKKDRNSCSSIMLYIKPSQHRVLQKKDYEPYERKVQESSGYGYNEGFIRFHLCVNNSTARLRELLWCQGDIKLCTIYPEQQIDISNWLAYPSGKSLFPLHANNSYQALSTINNKIHILVETDLEIYGPQASVVTKLENYGLITSWTARYTSINFIIETDVDRITSFIMAVMQGQRYINNGLLLKRLQSLSILGNPCIYDNEQLNELLSNETDIMSTVQMQWDTYIEKLKTLSNAAQTAFEEKKPIKVIELYGLNVSPQSSEVLTSEVLTSEVLTSEVLTSEIETAIKDNDKIIPELSISVPDLSPLPSLAVPNITKHNLRSIVSPLSTGTSLMEETSNAPNIKKKSDVLPTVQSSDTAENKNNILLNTDNKVSTGLQEKTVAFKATFANSESKHEEQTSSKIVKPPNVLIYADSPDTLNNIKTVLEKALDPDRYVIYALSREVARSNIWINKTALIVICGNVDAEIGAQLVEYIVNGGKLLALCSDMLHTLLPSFKTAEVRESELVYFSYGKWKHVRMMHHIFCYHASPVRARFSQDHEDPRTSTLNPPASTSVKDKRGNLHSFNVKVLATEETWHNPSILLATLASSGGKVVFSQIHLEVDPMQYEYEEDKFKALKESNVARLEIINDLLSTHLGMETNCTTKKSIAYTPAYFLGTFEKKLKFIKELEGRMEAGVLKMPNLDIQFYTSNTITKPASASFLPVMAHSCPANFSTVKYFESLRTREVGRLVIYTDVLTSSMNVTGFQLEHGLAVITRHQTKGFGRSQNIWLSPMGCAMFTLQMHISKESFIGCHLSCFQHYIAVALVHSVRSKPGYENINLRLKWPNDIYASSSTKIGGLIVRAQREESQYICNIGVGLNLSNSKPTSCINDVIQEYNQKHGTTLKMLLYEEFLAEVFNSIESFCDILQDGVHMEYFNNLYYTYWLHQNANVTVMKTDGKSENVTIVGIDDFGYLLVQESQSGIISSVHPDGNTFDLFNGLIMPK